MTSSHEMQETIARALCENSTRPCNEHSADAGIAVSALVLAGYLQTGGGAGDTPPATSAATPGPAAQAGEAIGSPTPSPPFPRRFRLYRHEDPSGVSGTKWVAEGIQFIDGYTALRWFGEHPCTVPWDSIERIIAVHGHGGLTEIVWLDGAE